MEAWRTVLRDGLFPQLTIVELEALEEGLATDHQELIQGATCQPPPLSVCLDWNVEAACLVGYCGWKGLGLQTVGEVEDYFFRVSQGIDERMGEPAACRYLYNTYDETPREEFFPKLLVEVSREISLRNGGVQPPPLEGEAAANIPA